MNRKTDGTGASAVIDLREQYIQLVQLPSQQYLSSNCLPAAILSFVKRCAQCFAWADGRFYESLLDEEKPKQDPLAFLCLRQLGQRVARKPFRYGAGAPAHWPLGHEMEWPQPVFDSCAALVSGVFFEGYA